MQTFLEHVARTWPVTFHDLAWIDQTLAICLPLENIVSVRFSLQEEEFLHLKMMHLLVPDETTERNYRPVDLTEATLHISSYYPNSEDLVKNKDFFKDDQFIGFHTEKELAPWAEVKFSSPISSGLILLSNRSDEFARRARTLLVTCIDTSGKTIKIYDALDRLKEAERWLLQQYICACNEINFNFKDCSELILSIAHWQTERASESFQKNPLLQPYKKQFNEIAELYKMEFTIHGLCRSFRFWSEDEKASYLREGVDVANLLEERDMRVSFGFGAVLGYARSGDFIPHDDDLDLLVGFNSGKIPTISDGLILIEEVLKKAGYNIEGEFFSHRWISLPNGMRMDIFVGLIEGESLSFYPSRRNAYHVDDIFPSISVELHGVTVPMPRNIMVYLNKTYGLEWRVPDGSFSHSWDEAAYSDIK